MKCQKSVSNEKVVEKFNLINVIKFLMQFISIETSISSHDTIWASTAHHSKIIQN